MLTEKLNQIERAAIDVIAVFAPWLGPIPSAYLVGVATYNYLSWHVVVATVAAVAVESIGVVSIVSALRLYEWNETKTQKDAAAPLKLAVTLVAFYFVITIGLTVLLDVFPELARFAPAVFPLLAGVGAVNIAIKNGQQRREQRAMQRKGNRKATKHATTRNATGNATAAQRMAQLWQPGMGPTELAELAGCHKSTASRYINNGAMVDYERRQT